MPSRDEIKAVWERFRDQADWQQPVVVLQMIDIQPILMASLLDMPARPTILSFEIRQYGDTIVVEADGVVVEHLCKVQ